MQPQQNEYQRLFLNDLPLMDVRAPVEFDKGAFPHAQNLPLLNDNERQKVGTCYKTNGQDAAIELGHKLVSGKIKSERVAAWAAFAQAHPEGYLYCFRGGLRSKITQEWLRTEAGIDYPRVPGGYKAMRNFLIETIDSAAAECDFIAIGGLTGCGKTELLAELDNAIDLEAHAHHRGSSFGKHATPQPAQIDFENTLAIDLLKKRTRGHHLFVVEDEGRMIGQCSLPLALRQTIVRHPLVCLEDSFNNRVERILKDYVVDLYAEFNALQGAESGFAAFADHLRLSLRNIVKRLGAERYQRLAAMMDEALAEQQKDGSVDRHRAWIEGLLHEYYDPMYMHQLASHGERIVFRGDRVAVMDYLRYTTAEQNGRPAIG